MSEPVTRAAVTVTFLAMSRPPELPASFPGGIRFARVQPCSVPFYRYLYSEIGGDYLWWMRRAETDARIAAHLDNPLVQIHVLTIGEEPIGIAELDYRPMITVNLAYFGLMRHALGRGLGMRFLLATLTQAWSHRPRAVTVNTCNADHPRALPLYLRAGFVKVRSVDEVWEIPDRVGLTVPDRLKAK